MQHAVERYQLANRNNMRGNTRVPAKLNPERGVVGEERILEPIGVTCEASLSSVRFTTTKILNNTA